MKLFELRRIPAVIRVVIVDDHELVRRGLSDLLESDSELSVVGQAGNAYDAFHTVQSLAPEVVVLDVRLPDGNGVELCRDIKAHAPEIKVVMLTSFADDEALLPSCPCFSASVGLCRRG